MENEFIEQTVAAVILAGVVAAIVRAAQVRIQEKRWPTLKDFWPF